eukprot:2352345-Pyramimonas_sp.AAC.1
MLQFHVRGDLGIAALHPPGAPASRPSSGRCPGQGNIDCAACRGGPRQRPSIMKEQLGTETWDILDDSPMQGLT